MMLKICTFSLSILYVVVAWSCYWDCVSVHEKFLIEQIVKIYSENIFYDGEIVLQRFFLHKNGVERMKYWHERSAFQSVAVQGVDWQRRWWPQKTSLFSFFFFSFLFFSVTTFSHRRSAQKTYLAKVDGSAQKPKVRPLSRPRRPFWGPLAAILVFAGDSMFLIEGVLGSKNLFSES